MPTKLTVNNIGWILVFVLSIVFAGMVLASSDLEYIGSVAVQTDKTEC